MLGVERNGIVVSTLAMIAPELDAPEVLFGVAPPSTSNILAAQNIFSLLEMMVSNLSCF